MGRTLDALNNSMQRKVDERLASESDRFALYRKHKTDNRPLEVQFSACDKDGTFSTIDDNGIVVVMPKEAIEHAMMYFTPRAGRGILGTNFTVYVDQIDDERGYCYVKPVKRRRSTRNALDREIMRELSEGRHPTVWGIIRAVDNRRALVNILGQNILGNIAVQHWDTTYTRYLSEACKVGDYYQFQIMGQMPRLEGKDPAYFLSRKGIAGHAWESIPRDLVQEGASIIVKCIDIPEGKSFWWGKSPLAPDIEIMGDFAKRRVTVVPGISYKCVVKKLEITDRPQDNRFQVIPLQVCKADEEAYRRYQNSISKTVSELHEEAIRKESEELSQSAKEVVAEAAAESEVKPKKTTRKKATIDGEEGTGAKKMTRKRATKATE